MICGEIQKDSFRPEATEFEALEERNLGVQVAGALDPRDERVPAEARGRQGEALEALVVTVGAQRLPRNLLEATEILRDDPLAKEVMGEAMHKSYLTYKVDEWERYHQAVTDWEVQEYLRLY